MIQIICDEDGNPEKVGYSQHYGGDKRSWNNVNKVDGTHPEVYVAEGGHASYFESGTTWPAKDYHQGTGKELNPLGSNPDYSIKCISNENWLNFKGDWGEDGGSVPGPTLRHTKPKTASVVPADWASDWYTTEANMWIEPLYWHSNIG
ncbi:MAG: hypothetical protein ACOC6U_01850 [Thermoplasmatota archaeon]